MKKRFRLLQTMMLTCVALILDFFKARKIQLKLLDRIFTLVHGTVLGRLPDLWGLRGSILADLGREEEALGAYAIAYRIAPHNSLYYRPYGCMLSKLGRNDQALTTYAQILARQPDDAEILHYQAQVLHRLGRDQEGMRAIDHALTVKPKEHGYLLTKGELLLAQGHTTEAIAYLQRAVKRDRKCATAWSSLATAYLNGGQAEAAEQAQSQAAKLGGIEWGKD